MQLQHLNPHESYAEECQDRPCHFWWAVVNDGKLETHHGPVLCRDFLGDTLVWKAEEVKKSEVYSWGYNGKVEKDFTSLVMDNFGQMLHNVTTILNPIEEKLGINLTTVEKTDDGDHVWVKGDKFWMTTTVHFSWYTTLLRYLTYGKKFYSFKELEKSPTNSWLGDPETFSKFERLPYVLPKLEVKQVAGVKLPCDDRYTMHDYNGWYSNVEFEWKSKHTAYGDQLKKLLEA